MIFFPRVNIYTNATLLNNKRSKEIIDTNAIDEICFSLDGGNKEDYEYNRGSWWNTATSNIENFLDLLENSDREINTVVDSIILNKDSISNRFEEIVMRILKNS